MAEVDHSAPASNPPVKIGIRTKIIRLGWMILATLGISATVFVLVEPAGHKKSSLNLQTSTKAPSPVRVEMPGKIFLQNDSPMRGQLKIQTVQPTKAEFPIFKVSGSIIARIVPGNSPIEDRWQFASPELSSTYADWIRNRNDLKFAEDILTKSKQLSDAEVSYRRTVSSRLEALGATKAVPEKDVQTAKADLLRAEITGDRDVFEMQRIVFADKKTIASLERQLRQAGLETDMFMKSEENTVLISANVPESRISEVHVDQLCQVHFYGIPGQSFPGHVEALASNVTSDRRMLRMVFHLEDPKNQMKPGMFAEVGIGTEKRDAILIPSKAIVHIGSMDYVLVFEDDDTLVIREVETGEPHLDLYEVINGLKAGEKIISEGAVLLKPLIRDSLILESSR